MADKRVSPECGHRLCRRQDTCCAPTRNAEKFALFLVTERVMAEMRADEERERQSRFSVFVTPDGDVLIDAEVDRG